MKTTLITITTLSIFALPLAAWAEPATSNANQAAGEHAKQWDSLSHEQKKELVEKNMDRRAERREVMKETWEKMSPEEKAKAKEARKQRQEDRHAKVKDKVESLAPEQRDMAQKHREERKALREEIRKERGKEGHGHH